MGNNTLGRSFEDKMANIILTPNGRLIPYLGHKKRSAFPYDEDYFNIEIIGVGNKVNPLPSDSTLNSSADNILLIYDKNQPDPKKSFYLRTFKIKSTNSIGQSSSEYSYQISFAIMDPNNLNTNVYLPNNLDSQSAKIWLDAFNIKIEKYTPNLVRNFAGAAWVNNLCLDNNGEKNWNFSKEFINKLSSRHGDEFNYGIRFYKGRSIILWDTLRDFKS